MLNDNDFHYYLTFIFVLPTFEINDNVILHLIIDILPIWTKRKLTVCGEVYSMQHYVIKFVRDLQQVSDVPRILRVSPPIKLTATI
jgi:hypothetical protein